jgi:hypothetical protein
MLTADRQLHRSACEVRCVCCELLCVRVCSCCLPAGELRLVAGGTRSSQPRASWTSPLRREHPESQAVPARTHMPVAMEDGGSANGSTGFLVLEYQRGKRTSLTHGSDVSNDRTEQEFEAHEKLQRRRKMVMSLEIEPADKRLAGTLTAAAGWTCGNGKDLGTSLSVTSVANSTRTSYQAGKRSTLGASFSKSSLTPDPPPRPLRDNRRGEDHCKQLLVMDSPAAASRS